MRPNRKQVLVVMTTRRAVVLREMEVVGLYPLLL